MPCRSGAMASAAALAWSLLGLSGTAAAVLSERKHIRDLFWADIWAKRLTDIGSVARDGVGQAGDRSGLSVQLPDLDRVGEGGGSKSQEGNEDGLHDESFGEIGEI
jgi:hypothetical protein